MMCRSCKLPAIVEIVERKSERREIETVVPLLDDARVVLDIPYSIVGNDELKMTYVVCPKCKTRVELWSYNSVHRGTSLVVSTEALRPFFVIPNQELRNENNHNTKGKPGAGQLRLRQK